MHPLDRKFLGLFLKRLNDEDNDKTMSMRSGFSGPDALVEYSKRAGYLKALDDVREWLEQIKKMDDDDLPQRKA